MTDSLRGGNQRQFFESGVMVVITDNSIQLAVYQGVVNLAARNFAVDAKERVIRAYARFARLDAEVIVLRRRAKRRNDVV